MSLLYCSAALMASYIVTFDFMLYIFQFGKGVYFADMSSKSANYCFASRNKPIGFLVLCEVSKEIFRGICCGGHLAITYGGELLYLQIFS